MGRHLAQRGGRGRDRANLWREPGILIEMAIDEREAVARLKRGDIGGLEVLVTDHQLRAVRAAYLIVQDARLAEDIAQEAFLRAYSRIGQFDEGRPFGPWFYRIVVNLAQRAATRGARQTSFDSPATAGAEMTLEEALADGQPEPEALAEQAEQRARVWAALGRLTPGQRAAVVQRYYLGLSEADIAANLEVAPGTVKWRLHAARERLREWLRPWRAADH
jgi:RNA polymerase sigma-70 factor (ECF subfamily)